VLVSLKVLRDILVNYLNTVIRLVYIIILHQEVSFASDALGFLLVVSYKQEQGHFEVFRLEQQRHSQAIEVLVQQHDVKILFIADTRYYYFKEFF